MPSRPPFFAFYPADFASDLHVEAMTTLQVGAYMLLLCKAWQADPPASLPNDDQILARLARVDAATWAEVRAGVLAPFTLGTDGRLHSKRLRREYDTALRLMRAKQAAGKRGAETRWGHVVDGSANGTPNGSAMALPLARQCGGNAIQSQRGEKKEPPNPPEGGTGGRPPEGRRKRRPSATQAELTDPRFVRFWAAWPKRVAKDDAARAFAAVDPDEALLAAILAAVEAQARSDRWAEQGGRFIPHPATWLNGRRWTDEGVALPPPPDPDAEFRKKLEKQKAAQAWQ